MFDLKKEKIKKNICLTLSIIFALLFILGLIFVIVNDVNPIKVIIPPFLAFCLNLMLYKNTKKAIEENTKR